MITETLLDTGDLSLNLVSGPVGGAPLLFLHGVTRCWQDFVTLMPPLCLRWRGYAPDFRGPRQSGPTPGRYLILGYAHHAAEVLRSPPDPAVVFVPSLRALVAAIVSPAVPH